jgi:hypothetical protein
MVEVFSQAAFVVKQSMATSEFIGDIFSRAKFPSQASEPTASLNEPNLLCIVRSMNNLAMDKTVVTLLWQTELVERLIEFLDLDRSGPSMGDIQGAAFSALFHLSRILTPETVTRIAGIVRVTVYLIGQESPLKDLAVTLLLECISHHSDNAAMREELKHHRAFDALFGLLRTHVHKETVMSAIQAWGKSDQELVESSLLERITEFTGDISDIFTQDQPSTQLQVASHLLLLCDRCQTLTTALSLSQMVRTIIDKLLGNSLDAHPEIRKIFLSLIVSFYEAAENPKRMIAEFRIDKVAEELLQDQSSAVRPIAEQLMQAVASNYVL